MTTTTRGSGTADGDDGAERFARAVSSGLRAVGDPSLDADLEVVAALRRAGADLSPTAEESARMKRAAMARFLAEVPQRPRVAPPAPLGPPAPVPDVAFADAVDEPAGGADVVALPVQRGRPSRTAVLSEVRSRLVVAAAAALCLLMSLSGMSLLLSRDAVPGDALYGIKRVAEAAELGLTFGEQERAFKQLEFATNRVDEIVLLAEQAEEAGGSGEAQEELIRALDDFEDDTLDGVRRLTETAAAQGATELFEKLDAWGAEQWTRLDVVQQAFPLEVTLRMDTTLGLLEQVRDRATQLQERSGCAPAGFDELGALPAEPGCTPSATAPAPGAADPGQSPPQAGEQPAPAAPAAPAAPPQASSTRTAPPGGGPGRPAPAQPSQAPVPAPPAAEPDPDPVPVPVPPPGPAAQPPAAEITTTTPAPPPLVPTGAPPAPAVAGQVRLPALPDIPLG